MTFFGRQHWALEYYQDCSNDDLGLKLTFCTASSGLGLELGLPEFNDELVYKFRKKC